jgi:hypothetical protein
MMFQSAKRMLQSGVQAIPVSFDNEKRMPVVKWSSIQSLQSETELQHIFRVPHNAIAAICGCVSGNLEVIDFDLAGKYFAAWRDKVQQEAPELFDRLVIEQSRSGGYHVFYRCETIEKNQPLAYEMDDGKRKIAIETRGQGGIVFCAPSPGYVLLQEDFDKIPLIQPEERQLLLSVAKN